MLYKAEPLHGNARRNVVVHVNSELRMSSCNEFIQRVCPKKGIDWGGAAIYLVPGRSSSDQGSNFYAPAYMNAEAMPSRLTSKAGACLRSPFDSACSSCLVVVVLLVATNTPFN